MPCTFMAKDVWWRGIGDLIILNDEERRAHIFDYKTGKPDYASVKQLEILSLAVFKHFPHIKSVKAGLVFLVHPDVTKAEYERSQAKDLWVSWLQDISSLETSYENEVWNCKPNFTCKGWCPVVDCRHHEPRRSW